MINTIKVTNIVTGDFAQFDRSNGHFIIDEIDWDTPSVSLETYHIPYQIGDVLAGVSVGSRKPMITGYVVADIADGTGMTWKEYYSEQQKQINSYKKQLNKLFSVFQDIKLEVGNCYMICRAISPILYSTKEKENNEVLCKFSVELLSVDSTFHKDSEVIQLASVSKMFHFPTIFNTITFGSLQRKESVIINNTGDVETGCIIVISAVGGSVINPEFYNVDTGQFIGFELQLDDGDELLINTNKGEENAIVRDVSESKVYSALGNLKSNSEFLQISQGNSAYAYRVEQASSSNVEASIEYSERFFNLEDI